MLDWTDATTVFALRTLRDVASTRSRPLSIWVGAGASRWCGYDGWTDVAEQIHQDYLRHDPTYDRALSATYLSTAQYPALFSLCRRTNQTRYNTFLAGAFSPRPLSPVYQRFLSALKGFHPGYVLTTNVDELLEKSLQDALTVSRFDIERLPSLIAANTSFVAKLHGTVSDMASLIFSTEDYDRLTEDNIFQESLRHVLRETSVLFIGYGLRDDYLLQLLERNAQEGPLFGDGPHFAVVPNDDWSLPPTVQRIKYTATSGTDHRSAISVIEEASLLRHTPARNDSDAETSPLTSGHFLHELFLPGTSTTSQTLEVQGDGDVHMEVIVGDGFVNAEMPNNASRALHDVVVGLLCFDRVFAPISAAGQLHLMLGAAIFWRLVQTDILKFVSWKNHISVVFPSHEALAAGELNMFAIEAPDGGPDPIGRQLRQQIVPAPGKESEGERQLASLEEKIVQLDDQAEGRTCSRTLSLLLRSSVRKALAISEGSSISSISRWQLFPVLRLSTLVRIAGTCAHLGIPSARINVGIAALAGPAFSLSAGADTADDAAGYVIAGSFASDLGVIVGRDPSILETVLSFRDTAAGIGLRKDVLDRLAVQSGYDAVVAINAGLKAAIPVGVLQRARDEMTKLFINTRQLPRTPAAFWSDISSAQDALDRWKVRSRAIFQEVCRANKIGPYQQCPCGSGEKTKFCCGEAVS